MLIKATSGNKRKAW